MVHTRENNHPQGFKHQAAVSLLRSCLRSNSAASSVVPSHSDITFRHHRWRGMENYQDFFLVVFHGFVADEMRAVGSESRAGDPQQHPQPFSRGFVGL